MRCVLSSKLNITEGHSTVVRDRTYHSTLKYNTGISDDTRNIRMAF